MSDQEFELDPKLQEQRKQRREELRKKRAQRKMMIYAALAVILVLVLILAIRGCSKRNADDQDQQPQEPPAADNTPITPPEDTTPDTLAEDASATLTAVGDIMCYDEQIDDADQGGGSYDFSACLAGVAEQLSAADLTVGNLETNFAGTPYSGYPNFSSPPALADALAAAGFDVLQTANTYSLENGLTGLQGTITTLDSAGITAVGTYASKADADENGGVVIKEVNGIKFAFIAYTKGINGRTRPADSSYCVNILYTDYTTNYSIADETALLKSVQSAKAQEADVIIAMLHWGDEYAVTPLETQNEIADLLFQNGVDVILGSHSHVVGPMEERTVTTVDGETKNVFIAYSLGNFLSSMNKEDTQASAILNLSFFKSGETGKTSISKVEYTPVYIADNGEEAENRYTVLNIADEVDRYIGAAEGRVSEELYNELKSALDTLHTNAGTTYAAK